MKLPFMSMIVIAGTAVGAVKVPEYRAVEPGCASETIVFARFVLMKPSMIITAQTQCSPADSAGSASMQ